MRIIACLTSVFVPGLVAAQEIDLQSIQDPNLAADGIRLQVPGGDAGINLDTGGRLAIDLNNLVVENGGDTLEFVDPTQTFDLSAGIGSDSGATSGSGMFTAVTEVEIQTYRDAIAFAPVTILSIDGSTVAVDTDKPLSSQLYERFQGSANFGDLSNFVPKNKRDEQLMKEFLDDLDLVIPGLEGDVTVQQVAPGTPIGGGSAPDLCKEDCGTAIVNPGTPVVEEGGHAGPACPADKCGGVVLAGCNDEYCGHPARDELPETVPGLTAVKYRKNGYPEVLVLTQVLSSADGPFFKAECSAFAITPLFVLTALHCLAKDEADFDANWSLSPTDVAGWSEIKGRGDLPRIYSLVSETTGETAFATRFFVPYAAEGPVAFSGKRPSRDLVMLQLENAGLGLTSDQLPRLDFANLADDASISFAGFGWTNFGGIDQIDWLVLAINEKWRELKQAAFNFTEGVLSHSGSDFPMITWRNGVPKGTGGPCSYDSGGPVYAGFNRGFWNDPRRLVGVVSAFISSPAIDSAQVCLNPSSVGVGELLANYEQGLCNLPSTRPRGCG